MIGDFPSILKPSSDGMQRTDCLTKAWDATADRQGTYGSPTENFGRIAQLWGVYLGHTVRVADVPVMMALVKIARLQNTPDHGDSWVDLAGYAALGAEVSKAK